MLKTALEREFAKKTGDNNIAVCLFHSVEPANEERFDGRETTRN